tara:strand:- start:3285 stop:4988 length:1704 start_codon:yes stop_codon:yes gene_type:complete
MKTSFLFGKTTRETPSEAQIRSHQLMVRTSMIQSVASGIYSYMPLALRSMQKIEHIIREEIGNAGGQEVLLPTLHPVELWESTGRSEAFGDNLFRTKDRRNRGLVLAPTHEEVMTNLVKFNISSYRDLPLILYQIQTKFRDEPRPRAGLMRVREFDMKDAYSFDINSEGLDVSYQKMKQAYKNIFSRCGLSTIPVEADSGAIGGKDSQEFILPAESGEDLVLSCPNCEYAANVERAEGTIPSPPTQDQLPIKEVATPNQKTIPGLCKFLNIEPINTLKALFYTADDEMIFVVTRGDLEVNEVKLKNLLKASDLRLANNTEVENKGLIAGSAGPMGIKNIKLVGDSSIINGSNFVIGANKHDFHLLNVNYERDFVVDILGDITKTEEGHGCPSCGGTLREIRGIEVGHIFKLGTFFSEALGCLYLNDKGEQLPVHMGCYGIGVGRLLAAAIEQNHDDKGIIFPTSIAPFHIHLVSLNTEKEEVVQQSNALYNELTQNGQQVLYDDRSESPGVKLNDADLLGLPIRIITSSRNFNNDCAEVKLRNEKDSKVLPIKDISATIENILQTTG